MLSLYSVTVLNYSNMYNAVSSTLQTELSQREPNIVTSQSGISSYGTIQVLGYLPKKSKPEFEEEPWPNF